MSRAVIAWHGSKSLDLRGMHYEVVGRFVLVAWSSRFTCNAQIIVAAPLMIHTNAVQMYRCLVLVTASYRQHNNVRQ